MTKQDKPIQYAARQDKRNTTPDMTRQTYIGTRQYKTNTREGNKRQYKTNQYTEGRNHAIQ